MPPLGQAIALLRDWREISGNVRLSLFEMNERDLAVALGSHRLDVLLAPSSMLPPRAASLAVYRERLLAAFPADHALAERSAPVTWPSLSGETILVQGWDDSQAEREFLGPLLGSEVCFRSEAAGRQSIMALVAAGFGAAILPESQAETGLPGVVFLPVDEKEAVLQLDLAWLPETEEPAVGRFVAFVRDAVRSHGLV